MRSHARCSLSDFLNYYIILIHIIVYYVSFCFEVLLIYFLYKLIICDINIVVKIKDIIAWNDEMLLHAIHTLICLIVVPDMICSCIRFNDIHQITKSLVKSTAFYFWTTLQSI